VAVVRTEISEERIACIIRVKIIGEQGTTLAVTRNQSKQRRNTRATWGNITEDGIFQM
jgi:hypothetical protein